MSIRRSDIDPYQNNMVDSPSNEGREQLPFQTQWTRLTDFHSGLTQFIQSFEFIFNKEARQHTLADIHDRSQKIDFGLLAEHVGQIPPFSALIGWGENQKELLLDLSPLQKKHLFIAGHASSGKSSLLRTILLSLTSSTKPSQLQLAVTSGFGIPPVTRNRSGLALFGDMPHTLSVTANNVIEATDTIDFIKSELSHRIETNAEFPLIILVIDNVQDVIKLCPSTALESLIFIANYGLDMGIKLILSTNRPEDSRVQDILDAGNFTRIIGQMADANMAEIATNRLNSGVDKFSKFGEFLLIDGHQHDYFVAAFVEEAVLRRHIQATKRLRSPVLLAQSFLENGFSTLENRRASNQRPTESFHDIGDEPPREKQSIFTQIDMVDKTLAETEPEYRIKRQLEPIRSDALIDAENKSPLPLNFDEDIEEEFDQYNEELEEIEISFPATTSKEEEIDDEAQDELEEEINPQPDTPESQPFKIDEEVEPELDIEDELEEVEDNDDGSEVEDPWLSGFVDSGLTKTPSTDKKPDPKQDEKTDDRGLRPRNAFNRVHFPIPTQSKGGLPKRRFGKKVVKRSLNHFSKHSEEKENDEQRDDVV